MLAGAQAMTRAGAAGVRTGLTSTADLEATHGMTMSGREFARLKADIAKNGIRDSIKYVEYNGQKFVVTATTVCEPHRRLGYGVYRRNRSPSRTQVIEHRKI